MRATSVLATLAGAGTASAGVLRIAADTLGWKWSVTGWSAGCAHSGCYYDFNVTGTGNTTARPGRPSFKAYCNGGPEGAEYKVCMGLEETETDYVVVAKLLANNNTGNGTSQRPQIQVSLKYTDLETPTTWWNYTGKAEASYNQFVAPLMNFTITPDTVIGVA